MASTAAQIENIVGPGTSSHIVLESPDEEHSAPSQPENVAAQFELYSRIRGACIQLALYEEGFLAVREKYPGKRDTKRVLDLRYVDPRPRISRVIARKMGYSALGSGGLSAVLGVLGWLGNVPAAVFGASFLLGVTTAISAWLFLCRTGERVIFHTVNGRASVLTLFSNVGSIRALRRVVPVLAAAIREARDLAAGDKRLYLRQEIREHYRLAQGGILSEDDCATCTQRILQHFD